jgi:hypothetical protein
LRALSRNTVEWRWHSEAPRPDDPDVSHFKAAGAWNPASEANNPEKYSQPPVVILLLIQKNNGPLGYFDEYSKAISPGRS